jgi:hypothetical protein
MSAVMSSTATPGRGRRVRHKSYAMLIATVFSVALTICSLIARAFVCWGRDRDSYGALFSCHASHWSILAIVIGMLWIWALLFLELSELHPESHREIGRRRAAWRAYHSQLDRHEKLVSGFATLFLLIGILIIAYVVLLSGLRF